MKRLVLVLILLLAAVAAFAQTESARVSGRVTDSTGAVIVGVQCTITDIGTNVSATTATNRDGIYVFPDLHPATYRLSIQKDGFHTVVKPGLELHVQDAIDENFTLAVGSTSETVTVTGGAPVLQTESAAVSTVVDSQFVENMPLNGRSFQSLIALTPGVVFTSSGIGNGQFSVNGQRGDANYFMVDGVSANFGVSTGTNFGQTLGGTTPALTSGGGTNGLVSVDAMQEFRIQTSSYAPEFGHTPGAQISVVTRSGGNQFHGVAFDYLRNDIFDARNYFDFASPTNGNPALPKAALRQNDFGGTLGGPIWKNKTFFFFSYEGLRLRLPQIASSGLFYTASARAAVAPVWQPFVNAMPLPAPNAPLSDPTCQTPADPSGCTANITSAYSNPSTINATSIRIDHHLTKTITLFARYNHAPSHGENQNWQELSYDNANTDTMTAGATILLSSTKVNDLRANWSRSTGGGVTTGGNFDGATVPSSSALFPPSSGYSPSKGQGIVEFPDGDYSMEVREGEQSTNTQRQVNLVDTFTWAVGTHQLKFGADYRRLSATAVGQTSYVLAPDSFSEMVAGDTGFFEASVSDPASANVTNYSLFAQDTWKASPRLTLTYGVRWEINTPPASATAGKPFYTVQGIFDSNPLAAVPGDLWHTKFGNFAPRIGAAYKVTPKTVVRGGFGLFYDLGYGSVGTGINFFPYSRDQFTDAPTLPLDLAHPPVPLPPFSTAITAGTYLNAVDPNLQLPFTMQWNAAIEREVGSNQTLTVTYLGSDGRRLLRSDNIVPPLLQSFGSGLVATTHNGGYSHYNALQAQFQRRMSRGLQMLVSYNFAKSSDLGSSDADRSNFTLGIWATSVSQLVLPPLTPSDFDIRHSLSGAVSYDIPAPAWGRTGNAILKGWAVDGLVRISSAPPLNITAQFFAPQIGLYTTQPNTVPGQPVWIPDPTQPNGKRLNTAAFSAPAVEQTGSFPRNGLRSPYSIDQTDLALRRRFDLTERVKLDLRAEYFNVFNHPMFGAPGSSPFQGIDTRWSAFGSPNPNFGQVQGTMNNALGGGGGGGGQSFLYAVGGPRSGQFTLKVIF